jgi:hypothetical protein
MIETMKNEENNICNCFSEASTSYYTGGKLK